MWGKYWIVRGIVDSVSRGGGGRGRLEDDGDGCGCLIAIFCLVFLVYIVVPVAIVVVVCVSPLPIQQKTTNVCVFSAVCLACPVMFFCGRVCDKYSPRGGIYLFLVFAIDDDIFEVIF